MRWTFIVDKLPEIGEMGQTKDVLVCYKDTDGELRMTIGVYDPYGNGTGWRSQDAKSLIPTPIVWMPLPEYPNESS